MASTVTPPSRRSPRLLYTFPIFGILAACGFYFIVVQMILSKAPDRFLEVHKASKVPLSLTHNTLHLVDKVLTPLVSFFVSAFGDPSASSYSTVVDFVWSFGAAILMPLIEAERTGVDGRHGWAIWLLSHPMIWGILYQRLSGGWILPLWLIAFMQSRTRAEGVGIQRAKAESVLFGWWFGHSIPAIAMLIPNQPEFTKAPIWIAFPILMSVAQMAYYAVRTRSPYLLGRVPTSEETKRLTGSGYYPIMLLYLSAFVGSCAAHIHIVIIPGLTGASCTSPTQYVLLDKFIGLARFLYAFFVPTTGLRVPAPSETTAVTGVVHFVQFDIIVVFSAVWIAIIWDLALRRPQQSSNSTIQTIVWIAKVFAILLVSGLFLGPGASTAAILAHRETELEEARQKGQQSSAVKAPSLLSVSVSPNSAKSTATRSSRYATPLSLSQTKCLSSPMSPLVHRPTAVF